LAGYRTVAVTVSTAVFMHYLDATVLNTAIPTIARDFGVEAVELNTAILAYQLSMAALMPLGSAIAERIGARNAYLISILIFLAGSILCALSPSLTALVAARTLQGVGGAMMMPVSRELVIRSAAKNELVSAMNWLIVPALIGPMLGPVVGGFIVTYSSWHWIFLINIPVALIGIVATLVVVPHFRANEPRPFDLIGMLIIAPTIFTLIFGLEQATSPRSNWAAWAMLGTGLLLGALYVRHARSSPHPVLDLSLLKIDSFRQSMLLGALMRNLFGAATFVLPLWFQLAMGMTAARTGGLVMLCVVGSLVSRFIGGPLIKHFRPRNVAVHGMATVACILLATALIRPDWPLWAIGLILFVQGILLTIPMMVINPVAYVDIAPDRTAQATGFYTIVQLLTVSMGVMTAVWTISLTGFFSNTGSADNHTYAGSFLILGAMAAVTMLATRRLDAKATDALR
jgi:EmrB/QacA subfamily drug resistance transporter